MKSRHRAREIALQILYQADIEQSANASALAASLPKPPKPSPIKPVNAPAEQPTVALSSSPAFNAVATLQALDRHFEHFQVHTDLRTFSAFLVAGVLNERAELDTLIETQATHWKLDRMAIIDRNLLRLALYELKAEKETPTKVILDEAIELAKQFGSADSASFINGILDASAKQLRGKA